MSTHRVEVIKLGKIGKHPNADSLEITQVWGYTVILRSGDFHEGDLAVYIEPDYVVPQGAEWCAFLGDKTRIRTKKLRGIWSQGLLIHAPEGTKEGDDVMELLGITRYVPPLELSASGDSVAPCYELAYVPKYDLENWRKYSDVFVESELIYATEKIHGANSRFAYVDGKMWAGSRTLWKKENPKSLWWQALIQNPWIEQWCQAHPGMVLFGEVFGQVQDLKYDAAKGQIMFRAFDVLVGNSWMDAEDFHNEAISGLTEAQRAPIVFHGAYDPETMIELSMGNSRLAKHLAEVLVIKPAKERTNLKIGRVALKLVSDRYLERAK